MKDLTIIFKPILSISEILFHVLVFLKKLSVSTFFKSVLILSGAVLFHPTPLSAAANSCPGDVITGNVVSGHLTSGILGLLLSNKNDYYRYYPGSGSLTISYDSNKSINFDVGFSCGSDNILSVDNQTSGTATVTLGATDVVYIHAQYINRSTDYTITIDFTPTPLIVHDNADDLCYENPSYSGLLCLNVFGIIQAGVLCKPTIPIRNQSTDQLFDVHTVIGSTELLNVNLISDCGIDGSSGAGGLLSGLLGGGDPTCGQETLVDLGPIAGIGLFHSGMWYDMPNYDANATHSIYYTPLVDVALFRGNNLYGAYMKNGEQHIGLIRKCGPLPPEAVETGPFDAWDTFRDNNSIPPSPADRKISTKIANKDFQLSLGSMNSENNQYEVKPGSGGSAEVTIYQADTLEPISNSVIFDLRNTNHESSKTFSVTGAYRDAVVGFKVCATNDRDFTTGQNAYELWPNDNCSGTIFSCDKPTYDTPEWHICYSSDHFAVRPDRFSLVPPDGENLELLRSGVQYSFAVYANPFNGSGTDGTEDYNQTKDNLDLNKTIMLSNGSADSENLLHGNLFFGESDFTFDNGISEFNGNNHVVNIGFDDIGDVNITLQDRNWADIDNDDTPQGCDGGIFNNGLVDLDIPEGAYICGKVNATYIPHHFTLQYVRLANNKTTRPFTYLTYNDDLNMSANIELKIIAQNANDDPTQNFTGGPYYYEHPVEVNLTVPTIDANDHNITSGSGNPLNIIKQDINASAYLGFTEGNRTITWDDNTTAHRIMFNYNKVLNDPNNPFDINSSIPLPNDAQVVKINVASYYTSSGGGKATISGESNATEGSAKFYYGRAKSSKFFYDDVTASDQNTPISVVVYCDTFPVCTELSEAIKNNGRTNDAYWWLSWNHNMNLGDGNITLTVDRTVPAGEAASVTSSVDIHTNAIDDTIVVGTTSNTRPLTVEIGLVTTDPTDTNQWLIYNPDDPILDPSPFYKVRFIGTSGGTSGGGSGGASGWAGHGDTGHVVEGDSSSKKGERLSW